MDLIYIGIKGSVVAVDRKTGETRWTRHLAGRAFVNVAFDQGAVFAHSKGELFCLDPQTGDVRWNNPLTGLGYGMVTMASPTLGAVPQASALAAQLQQEQSNAAAASAAT